MFKIDYVIIANNQNYEYKGMTHYMITRWNQLGVKVLYLNCFDYGTPSWGKHYHINREQFSMLDKCRKELETSNGNLIIDIDLPKYPKVVQRWFPLMISRWMIASVWDFLQDKVVYIGDGDDFPINKTTIYEPAYGVDLNQLTRVEKKVVSTACYWDGRSLASQYALGSTFRKILPFNSIEEVIADCEKENWRRGMMYATDEWYMNWQYDKFVVKGKNTILHKVKNYIWAEGTKDMFNLTVNQIDLISKPLQLSPFISFHGARTSQMTDKKWNKLLDLCIQFDKYNIVPPNYYYETIPEKDRWRDTVITKDGYVMLGDEYDDPNYHHKFV